MNDLTIIFLTVNQVPEGWASYHRHILEEAIGDTPIITVSKKPLDWGLNLIQEEEPSINNIYKQILRACNASKTDYIAIAEDDTLYHRSHFEFRPPLDSYAYNGHRWGLFTWGKPTYYWKERISNACMIAPRELVISSLNERFAKYPNTHVGELGKEKGMDINRQKTVFFYSEIGVIFFSHRKSLDPTEQHKSKRMGTIQAFDIPFWGRAEELVKHFV